MNSTSNVMEGWYNLRLYPGGIRWWREMGGMFRSAFGAFGGSGRGINTMQEVALRIFEGEKDLDSAVAHLRGLGWNDVADAVRLLHQDEQRERIEMIRAVAASERSFDKAHHGKDYAYFRQLVWNDLQARAGRELAEEEVSVRRMHYAAMAMLHADYLAKRYERDADHKEIHLIFNEMFREFTRRM